MRERSFEYEYCFVLGAGASYDFGYPTGQGLIKSISDKLRNPSHDLLVSLCDLPAVQVFKRNVSKTLHERTSDEAFTDYCAQLGNRIYFSGVNSIDSFLSRNTLQKDLCEEICKYLIIESIIGGEQQSLKATIDKQTGLSAECFRWEENWLRILFGRFFVKNTIEELISSLESHKLVFIVFNYDRLLEFLLTRSIVSLYGLRLGKVDPKTGSSDDQLLDRVWKNIEFRHVYGRYDGEAINGSKLIAEYGNIKPDQGMVQNIKTIRPDNAVDGNCTELIKSSKQIRFLGFGFDEMNMDILFKGIQSLGGLIKGTRYGLSDSFVNNVKRRFPDKNQTINLANQTVYDFVRENLP